MNIQNGRVVYGETKDHAHKKILIGRFERVGIKPTITRIIIPRKHPYHQSNPSKPRAGRRTIQRIKNLPTKQLKPFLPQPPRINPILPHKLNPQSLLNIHFITTNLIQRVLNNTLPSHLKQQVWRHSPFLEDSRKKRFTGFNFHLSTRVVFHYVHFCAHGEEEGVLTEGEFAEF